MTQTVILECSNGKKLKKNPNDRSSAMTGKTRTFPKGFVPDYRQTVETLGETEGFSSSYRADSENSCTPKRKCMSLNGNRSNTFNVPIQVISTKISASERKNLEMRLRGELEKVRNLQKKIQLRNPAVASGIGLSSSSDGHAKKQDLKRSISSRLESTKQGPPPLLVNQAALVLKQCETLLKNLMTHKYSWVFNTPVDVVKLEIPDYFNIIKHPMDLGTVKKKLASGSYSSPLAFASDVRLTFTNAMTYNPTDNDVHIMADALKKMFEKRWKPIGEKLAAAEVVKREEEATKIEPQPLLKKRKAPPMEHGVTMPKSVKPKMPYDEKQELRNRLLALLEKLPDHIIEFLKLQNQDAKCSEEGEDEIEIDFKNLNDDTLFKLRKLLDDFFGVKQSVPQAKIEPCEVLVESGVSNSSIYPCQVNEPADEDVDIGGDDPPISSYPPLEIEKDTAGRSSKCSISSSSSSDSGSSSSDSDSTSSSRSQSDAKAVTPTKSLKENGETGASRGLRDCNMAVSVDANRMISGVDQQVSLEADDYREGENATSERQVSPDKLYRAALLRNRFADTILKAREKTVNQGEKKDPEKLRREREELERQQREEKARIQAEAKAAEDARKRAEAAEAKRKRELEREAARKALLEMEKTVEINENSLFLKDLEILGTGRGENIPSRVHEMSPEDHLHGLGVFNLGGSNPLEQLGLYRKDDDEDEEECGPPSVPDNDVEEGEID